MENRGCHPRFPVLHPQYACWLVYLAESFCLCYPEDSSTIIGASYVAPWVVLLPMSKKKVLQEQGLSTPTLTSVLGHDESLWRCLFLLPIQGAEAAGVR